MIEYFIGPYKVDTTTGELYHSGMSKVRCTMKSSVLDDYDAIGKRLKEIAPVWLPEKTSPKTLLGADILWRPSTHPKFNNGYDWACTSQRALNLLQIKFNDAWKDKKLYDWYIRWSDGNSRDTSAMRDDIPEDFIFMESK